MTDFTAYDLATGRILHTMSTNVPIDVIDLGPTVGIIYGAYDGRFYYVAASEAVQRPVIVPIDDNGPIQADGVDSVTISGIPAGWAYEISNGASGTTDGTDIVLTALEAGTYTIRFTNWPYQDIEYTINASATPL